jgi:indole-3-glycerol phosphate synthase
LIGVNNRDLRTFRVDLATTERIARRLESLFPVAARRPLLVAESGIHTRADVERVRAAGADAILVGESLMRCADIEAQVRLLLEDRAEGH